MSDLLSLADKKIAAELAKLIASLPTKIQAIKQRNAAAGQLYSGKTIREVVAACKDALEVLAQVIEQQYVWAVTQSLLASQTWVERLVQAVPAQIAPLYEACLSHVQREATAAGAPNVAPKCIDELEVKRAALTNDVGLALRSRFAEKRRGLIRGIPSIITGWFSKLFTGGGH